MELETKKILKDWLLELKQLVFNMFTAEYNSKFCKRNYVTLKDTIEQYKNVIDDIDNLIKKYC